ncbi:hypothetical protein [Methylobacterium sp.]|uniref:hypothetical protein n=1 Tax=Methylobacterium sp. TaxID=409 RepID=UPI003C756EFE
MEARFAHILSRFPADELAIHRLYARDAAFRGICSDYEEAIAAIAYWRDDPMRVEDFRRLATEIEEELAEFLKRGARVCLTPDP